MNSYYNNTVFGRQYDSQFLPEQREIVKKRKAAEDQSGHHSKRFCSEEAMTHDMRQLHIGPPPPQSAAAATYFPSSMPNTRGGLPTEQSQYFSSLTPSSPFITTPPSSVFQPHPYPFSQYNFQSTEFSTQSLPTFQSSQPIFDRSPDSECPVKYSTDTELSTQYPINHLDKSQSNSSRENSLKGSCHGNDDISDEITDITGGITVISDEITDDISDESHSLSVPSSQQNSHLMQFCSVPEVWIAPEVKKVINTTRNNSYMQIFKELSTPKPKPCMELVPYTGSPSHVIWSSSSSELETMAKDEASPPENDYSSRLFAIGTNPSSIECDNELDSNDCIMDT